MHLANQFLGQEKETELQDLFNASDALAWHIEAQQPWGLTSWENYQSRSERWHLDDQEDICNPEMGQDLALSWESALPGFELEGLQVEPLNTGAALAQTGREMGNCLANYASRCASGGVRIFTIRNKGKLAAAAEIQKASKTWTPGQLEGPRRQDPGEGARRVMRALPEMYRAAVEQAERGSDVALAQPASPDPDAAPRPTPGSSRA